MVPLNANSQLKELFIIYRRQNVGKIRQMYEKADWWLEFNFIYVVLAVMLLCAVVCGWILYTDNRTANEYHDVTDTVQSVESDNREAR